MVDAVQFHIAILANRHWLVAIVERLVQANQKILNQKFNVY
jgi:hypothetical protein